jgi:cytochrome bd-type quinol oxidase subunit 2
MEVKTMGIIGLILLIALCVWVFKDTQKLSRTKAAATMWTIGTLLAAGYFGVLWFMVRTMEKAKGRKLVWPELLILNVVLIIVSYAIGNFLENDGRVIVKHLFG